MGVHDRRERVSIGVAFLAAAVPIAVAVTRALHRGWYPVGDNAYFSLRARDVLTEHHPLLGTWTSASLSVGKDINNPGPIFFDLLAVPAKIAPIGGIAVGAALLNIACIATMGVVAHRGGGAARSVGVLLSATVLGWSMGSELSFDPWQPHALLFPFLLFLVTVWSLVEGDVWVLPVAVGVASLLVQTHLSYSVLVPFLGLLGVAGVAFRAVRRRGGSAGTGPGLRRPLLLSALVAAACWSQTLLEQVTAREGNLGRLASTAGAGDDPSIGLSLAARFVAGATIVPPAWARPSFGASFLQSPLQDPAAALDLAHTPSTVIAALGLSLVAGLLVAAGWSARRRHDTGMLAGVIVVGAATGLALLTTASLPIGRLGIGPHQVRWLWPISVLLSVVLILGAAGSRRLVSPVLAGLALLFGVLSLPTYDQGVGPTAESHAMPVLNEVARQLDGLEVDGPVMFAAADLSVLPIFDPYSTPLMLELARRGVEIVVDDPSQARQIGDGRKHPERATSRIVLRPGDSATAAPPAGARRIADVAGLGDDERRELDRLIEELSSRTSTLRLQLTADGRRAVALGTLPGISMDGTVDVPTALAARSLVVAEVGRYVADGTPDRDTLHRYASLQRRWDRQTLAVYLVPIDRTATEVAS